MKTDTNINSELIRTRTNSELNIFNCLARRYAPGNRLTSKTTERTEENLWKGLSNEGYATHTPTLHKPKFRLTENYYNSVLSVSSVVDYPCPFERRDCRPASSTKDAVRLQEDSGYDRTLRAAGLGRRTAWRV